jgi:hypothetical protein
LQKKPRVLQYFLILQLLPSNPRSQRADADRIGPLSHHHAATRKSCHTPHLLCTCLGFT